VAAGLSARHAAMQHCIFTHQSNGFTSHMRHQREGQQIDSMETQAIGAGQQGTVAVELRRLCSLAEELQITLLTVELGCLD
jgi:hypothetical protein